MIFKDLADCSEVQSKRQWHGIVNLMLVNSTLLHDFPGLLQANSS